jgi:hypothetical protein
MDVNFYVHMMNLTGFYDLNYIFSMIIIVFYDSVKKFL